MVTIWLDGIPELREYDWVRLTGDDGTVVEIVRLSCTSGRDGEWIRVKRGWWHIAGVRTVSELADLGVDLAELHEAD